MPFTKNSLVSMKRAHDFILAETSRAMREALAFGGRHAVNHVWSHPGFKPNTGRLQGSTKAKVVRTRGGNLLRLTNSAKYAVPIDTGARPHVIKGRNGGFLHFKGKFGWVRTRSVDHPGNRPYKFMYRAHHSAARVIERNLTQKLSRIASR